MNQDLQFEWEMKRIYTQLRKADSKERIYRLCYIIQQQYGPIRKVRRDYKKASSLFNAIMLKGLLGNCAISLYDEDTSTFSCRYVPETVNELLEIIPK